MRPFLSKALPSRVTLCPICYNTSLKVHRTFILYKVVEDDSQKNFRENWDYLWILFHKNLFELKTHFLNRSISLPWPFSNKSRYNHDFIQQKNASVTRFENLHSTNQRICKTSVHGRRMSPSSYRVCSHLLKIEVELRIVQPEQFLSGPGTTKSYVLSEILDIIFIGKCRSQKTPGRVQVVNWERGPSRRAGRRSKS